MRLTDTTIADLVCPAGRKDALFFDDRLKGFGIRVMPSRADGTPRKVFLLQYRASGKVRREPIGDWSTELTATQARKRAETLRGKVRALEDPFASRKADVAAERAAAAERNRQKAVDTFTFDKLVVAWEMRALSSRRASYRKEATARLRQGLDPWKDRPAAGITRSDAATALVDLARDRGPIGANRIMAYARACYGWAMKANLLEANPFAGLAAPGREKARDRVLTATELGAVWKATDTLGTVQRAFVRFLILTLQRRDEVAGATWSEFSADLTTWTIPAIRAKNSRAHLVHLAPAAQAVVATLPRSNSHAVVFAIPGGKKLSAYSAIKRALDRRLGENEAAAAEASRQPAVMPGWTFHDFRRTGVTVLAGLGFPPHVCDRLLNHVTGAIQGVAAVYQRAEFLAERKAALDAWAALCSRSDGH